MLGCPRGDRGAMRFYGWESNGLKKGDAGGKHIVILRLLKLPTPPRIGMMLEATDGDYLESSRDCAGRVV